MRDDPDYLKQYVKKHPDNKMAWYLLGKHYAAEGNSGKARYCFAKAGDVYEAFEREEAPFHFQSLEAGEQRTAEKKRWPVSLWRTVLAVVAAAAMMVAPLPGTNDNKAVSPGIEAVPQALSDDTDIYWVRSSGGKAGIEEALRDILLPGSMKSRYTVLVQLPTDDKGDWVMWEREPKVILSVERSETAEQLRVQYHDAESCSCQPSDPAKASEVVRLWVQGQEQSAVMKSAMLAYNASYGPLPADVDTLLRPYPHNVLPGYTPMMAAAFSQLKMSIEGEVAKSQNTSAGKSEPSKAGAEGRPLPLAAPLEIIVDKAAHRLALVSGDVIVRSYPVGLGGSRTPEGSFAITEKVVNPNGRSNGDFGSRGMTLSDTLYAIHGTNQPSSIGKDRSLGCIRMLQDDVEELYDMVTLGTKVTISSGKLPGDGAKKAGTPFRLPQLRTETNPGKTYHWLN